MPPVLAVPLAQLVAHLVIVLQYLLIGLQFLIRFYQLWI